MGSCPLIRPPFARPLSPHWGKKGAATRPATASPLGERVARAKPEPGEGDYGPGQYTNAIALPLWGEDFGKE
jgi:hypothetical protein